MPTIYHIARKTDWDQSLSQGSCTTDSLGSDGFIHCSLPRQLIEIANCIYKGQTGLVLLCLDESRIQAEIRYENCTGGEELFPHIYGPLNLDAVVKAVPFPAGPDGFFGIPEGIEGL